MTSYLGIDYGLAHIGLATSEHTLASPLSTLANDGSLLPKLKQIIQENHITTIVCGVPDGKLVAQVEQFARDLQAQSGIVVILHPETLSTQEAKQKLTQIGASRSKRKNDHVYAACLILEDFLELQNHVY